MYWLSHFIQFCKEPGPIKIGHITIEYSTVVVKLNNIKYIVNGGRLFAIEWSKEGFKYVLNKQTQNDMFVSRKKINIRIRVKK